MGHELRKGRGAGRVLVCAALLSFSASRAGAELVTYQKGDGKGSVSETDDTSMRVDVPDTTWVDAGENIEHLEVDLSTERHTVLKFPNIFGTGDDQIPPGSLIVSATLTLYLNNDGTDCPSVYQLTEGWTEAEVTWNSRRTGVSWSDPGADGPTSHKPALEGTMPCNLPTGFKNLDVTTSVQNWSNGELNEGWALVDNGPSTNGAIYFSSEHTTPANRPQLSVTYLPSVFYSVGTNAADLKTGSPTISIVSGVATLDVAQTGNIGVGDVIDHDADNKLVYIWDVVSPTVFRVQTAMGTAPTGVAGVSVNSIKRAFNSIVDAVTDSSDGNHLGNGDLTAVGRSLTWVCYKDGPFIEEVDITGYTTDSTHYITLTVAGASQVASGNSQRHRGTDGTGAVIRPPAAAAEAFSILEAYTRIEWIEIDGSNVTVGGSDGIELGSGPGQNAVMSNLLIHHWDEASDDGIWVNSTGAVIRNTILHSNTGSILLFANNATIQNVTIHGATAHGVRAANSSTGHVLANVIAMGTASDFSEVLGGTFASVNNCISSDNTADDFGGAGNQILLSPEDQFLSIAGSINLHLRAGADAIDAGTDLSASFANDIDDETRPLASAWDVGADESFFTGAVPHYRSIGSAADLVNQGTITITAGSPTVTKTGGLGWLSENRGRGDVLIQGANEYMIEAVISDDELRLASLPTTGFTGSTYTIARQHTTLTDWVRCVANITVCPYFTVSSSSLVADNRREVGIAYNDSTFVLTGNFDFQGSTTDATHDIVLTVDRGNRHNGTPGAGVVIDANGPNEVRVRDSNVTVEWLELRGCKGANFLSPLEVFGTDGDTSTNVLLQNLLIHDFNEPTAGWESSGIDLAGDNTLVGKSVTIRNTMIWDGDQRGIEGDEPLDTALIENVSIDGMVEKGIWAGNSTFTVRNSIVTNSPLGDYDAAGGSLSGSYNTSSDTTAGTYFTNFQNSVSAASVFVTPNADLHLKSGANPAVDSGTDLSGSFWNDIDGQSRLNAGGWDRGADERDATTAVELASFSAASLDGAVELSWRTASELDNLGFHVYRATSVAGPYERITASAIPGLGSSPVGASYRYRDVGVDNRVTYYYQLEDIETTGTTARHGPVSGTPGAASGDSGSSVEDVPRARIAYGDPSANALNVLKRDRRGLLLELVTEGFYAEPQDDGTVRLIVPGFESLADVTGPDVPVKHTWVDAVAGRKVKLASVQARRVEAFTGLRPTDAELTDVVATPEGTVHLRQGARRRAFHADGLIPESAARVVSVGFQGEDKKALVELAPLRWDGARGQLLLARRLVVRVSFRGRERSELATDGVRGRRLPRRGSHEERNVVARLRTTEKGLHHVRFEDLFRGRGGVPAKKLRLSRQGESVAFHIAPDAKRFRPGSVLYFVSAGGTANPYGNEAVYELELGRAGDRMPVRPAAPAGEPQPVYWHRRDWEQDRYYQAALVEAPDLWLWDVLFAPVTKTYPLEVSALAPADEPSKLSVWLQGVSDFPANPDHHVRVLVNGALVSELAWDGKQARHLEAELAPGVLRDGDNVLELENVGDTEASSSMVMLDRYRLEYPRRAHAIDGRLEGRWDRSGTAELSSFSPGAHVLDVSDAQPLWLVDTELSEDGTLRFGAETGRSYLAVSPGAVHEPTVVFPRASQLKSRRQRADYLVIGPRAFLQAATPLLELRRTQGLRVKTASVEEIYSEFGFGETTPEAVKDFLSYAYHQWRRPSPRYVLLLGDGTFDFEDTLQTGVTNHVPPRMVKTTYLWTASDPSYAAVNGDDLLPDVAIGRLPAANVDEVVAMVHKIVAFETSGAGLDRAPLILVADDPDAAGNFVQDADRLAHGVLAQHHLRKIYLGELGPAATRGAIRDSFDDGASLVSYIGHGGINLWAGENVFNARDVATLAPQTQQPLLLTMNCLNGYFHFPYFDSLAEALVKARDKGAIAAFSPSGLSLNDPANVYHQALLRELFHEDHARLGDAVLAAQKAYAETGAFPELLTIYHLLGDPALTLGNSR